MASARPFLDKASDLAVTVAGTAAGTAVAPGTALSMLKGKVMSARVLALLAVAAAAFAVGRRTGHSSKIMAG